MLCAVALCINCFAQPAISFRKKKIKLKEVKAGQLLRFDFFFDNTGNQPLMIERIKVACSCTQFQYPEGPVLPHKSDTIHVSFDTKGKIGWQYRTLEVFSNASSSPDKVQFIVNVKASD